MFAVTVTFEVEPARAADFLARVRRQAEDSLTNEEGCHRFDVCIDPERPERAFLYEVYADRAAFEAHMETPHYKAFQKDSAPMLRSKHVETWELKA